MKATAFSALCLAPSAAAFALGPAFGVRSIVSPSSIGIHMSDQPDVEYGGNPWKPDSGGMRSTDTGDFYPEDYQPDVEFTDGMGGSQGAMQGSKGPQLPGMENLGADAVMVGGIEQSSEIPAGMEFVPSSIPDGEVKISVAASGSAVQYNLQVPPVCMTFEDFYAAFAPGSHPSLSLSPQTGRMDRRGGEISEFTVTCDPRGQSGTFKGDIVINLPEDNSKICYKVIAESF